MPDALEQRIEVKAQSLTNLIASVENGWYRIPQFQREYVWSRSKVLALFDSLYNEYPIGSFFLWKAEREHNHLFRHAIDLDIPPVREDENVSFILDGQQRITSLYVTLRGLTANGTDYGNICFDLKDERFVVRNPDDNRYVALCDIWGDHALTLMRGVDEEYAEALNRCHQRLRGYPVSVVEVRDKDLAGVCKIFQRINQGGKRLDRFDLVSAMTFSRDFDLRERFKSDLIGRLEAKNFGAISPAVVTQLLALAKYGACTERNEYALTADYITETWSSAVDAVLLAADTLRKGMGVAKAAYLPYDANLTLLSYYFLKSGDRSLSSDRMDWVRRWFWRSAFGQHYAAGGPTKMAQDRALFDALAAGDQPDFDPPLNLTVESLVSTKMTQTRAAVRTHSSPCWLRRARYTSSTILLWISSTAGSPTSRATRNTISSPARFSLARVGVARSFTRSPTSASCLRS